MDLRRIQSNEDTRQPAELSGGAAKKYRDELNSDWSWVSNPYTAWRAKRSSIETELSKLRPNYTQDELNKVYKAVGLDNSTDPGDFNRESGFFGSLSRAGQIAANSAGTLVDTAGLKFDDWTGDTEGMMENQEQLDQQAMENSIIQNFQKQSGGGQNKVTQFLFDLAASAPIMAGVMGVGAAGGWALGLAGVPAWLAGMLGMGAADALSEMGFNYADIVTDPMVREKMERAVGEKLNDQSMEEIRLEVQKRLMDEADSSAAQVGVANFINPLNWQPVSGKFQKLMRVGEGRMKAIGRQALGSGVREMIEEFGQSVGSQYTAAEAKMKAMRDADVDQIPELGVDFKQAGYEALMGLTVGGTIGAGGGYKNYGDWASGRANVVEEGIGRGQGLEEKLAARGELLHKKPGDKNFLGKGPIQSNTRRLVDANDSDKFLNWYYQADPREQQIIDEELEKMNLGEELMGEVSSPEVVSSRKENAKSFIFAKENMPTLPALIDETVPADADIEIADDSLKIIFNDIRKKPEELRKPREKALFDLIQEYPNGTYKDIDRAARERLRDEPKPTQTSKPKETVSETIITPVRERLTISPPKTEQTKPAEPLETSEPVSATVPPDPVTSVDEAVPAVEAEEVLPPVIVNQSKASGQITDLLNQWLKDAPNDKAKIYSKKEQHSKNSSRLKKEGKKLGLPFNKKDRYSFTPDQILNVAKEIAAQQGIIPTNTVVSESLPVEVTPEVKVEESAPLMLEKPAITRSKPDARNYDKDNNELPQKIDDADVSQFINRVVIIETPNRSNKRSYLRVEGGPEAQSKIDREKAGLRTGSALSPRNTTTSRAIQFKGIKDGKIIFYDVKGGTKTDLTVPNLPLKKVPVGQATAENALRHLQTLEEKSFVGIKEKEVGKEKFNVANSSYQTVYSNQELQESDQAAQVRERQDKISALQREIDTLEDEVEIATMQAKIDTLDEELASLLPEKPEEGVRVREGEPSVKGDPLNIRGQIQRTVNGKIKNLKKVLDENNNTFPKSSIEQTLTDIENTSPEKITFDRKSIEVDGDTIFVDTALSNMSSAELDTILYTNGFNLMSPNDIEMSSEPYVRQDQMRTLEIALSTPVSLKDKKFTDPIIDPDTGEDIAVRERAEKQEYEENLKENITRVNAPPTEDEPQLGEVIKTQKEEAKLEKKREEVAEKEDTREADALDESSPQNESGEIKNWRQHARDKMAKYNSTKKGNAGISTTEALGKIRASLNENANKKSDEELLEYLWAKEGRGTKGTPNVVVVGGKSGVKKLGFNNVEVTLKDKDSPEVYTPKWTSADAPYKKLANDFINEKPAPVKPIKKPVPKSAPEPTVDVEPKETTQAPAVASPIITIEELTERKEGQPEDNLGTIILPGDKEGKWTTIITSPEKSYYQDVSEWDARNYTGSAGFTNQIKEDLPGSTRAPKKLTELIRNRMRDWLVGRVQTEEDIDSLKVEMEERYWPILTKDNRDTVNEALIAKGSTPIPTTILKKKSKVREPVTTEPTPQQEAPIKQGFISENALSAEKLIPTKKPSAPDVWYVDPYEIEDIFMPYVKSGQLVEYESFTEQEFPYGFEVVRKGKKWFMIKLDMMDNLPIRVDKEGKLNKMEVPSFIKDVLTRRGKETFGRDKPIDQKSYKLSSTELTDPKLASELLVNLKRKENVLDELNEAHHDKKRIKYARISMEDKTAVETFWLNKDFESVDENGNELKAFITFKSEELAQEFVNDIRKNNPSFDKLDKINTQNILNEQIQGGAEAVVDEAIGELRKESLTQGSVANIELMEGLEQTDPDLDDVGTITGFAEDYWDSGEEAKTIADNIKRLRNRRVDEDGIDHTQDSLSFEELQGVVDDFKNTFPSIPAIEIVDTHTDLPIDGDNSDTYGMYEDGKIYIVRSAHPDTDEVLRTLWHEGVGHLGLENYLGENNFNKLVDLIEGTLPDETFNSYLKDIGEGTPKQRARQAAKEYLAHQADGLFQDAPPTLWDKIVTWFREAMYGMGARITWNERDIKMLLLRSADKLRTGAPIRVINNEGTVNRRSSSQQDKAFNRTSLDETKRGSWDKMYGDEKTAQEGSWWYNIRRSLAWNITDPYSNIKEDIGMTEYMVARLAKRADGILATVLKHSGIAVDRRNVNGVLVNETNLDTKVKGLFQALKPLGTETERKQFFAWIAYNRASKLSKEGRENRFNEEDIKAGLTYNEGKIRDATTGAMLSRSLVYDKVRKDVMNLNNSILDFGVKMGLLQAAARNNFEQDFYVPFYRIINEEIGDSMKGNPVQYNSLTGQKTVKRLKGSTKGIGDPFNNLLHNWLHIIDASVKNDAAVTTIRSAVDIKNPMDSSQQMVERTYSPSARTLRVLEGGKEKLYDINNKLLYQSLASLGSETKFPGLKYLIDAKGLFTQIVTANPVFKINNIVRDTVSAAGTSDVGFNFFKNAVGGYRSIKDSEARMLVSGGYIQFANLRSDDPNYAETMLKKELSSGYMLSNPETDETFLSALSKAKKMGRTVWDSYSKIGDKLENANRASLFKALLEGGKSQTEAAFEARDLMDFTLHGGSDWVKLVTSLTPFANAMLQGKYKLGRSIINNPKPVAIVAGLVLLASIFEEIYFEDDEEYQNRPDWDKDTYWWLKIPGTKTVFKLPKPHEFSMVGNIAWRSMKLAEEKNPDLGKAVSSIVTSIVSREFGIVPLPQAIKPIIELGMNRNLFFDRDIEPKGSQGRSPSLRYGQYTSETMMMASKALSFLPIDKLNLSPYQLEHLVNGYFGWLGELVLGGADMVTRTTGDFPERPARELLDYPMARRLFKSSPYRNTKASSIYYERLKELEQTVQDLKFYRKVGDWEKYNETYDSKAEILKYHGFMRKKKRNINDFNNRITDIRNNRKMSGEEKEVRLDRMYQLRNGLIDKTVKILTGLR